MKVKINVGRAMERGGTEDEEKRTRLQRHIVPEFAADVAVPGAVGRSVGQSDNVPVCLRDKG